MNDSSQKQTKPSLTDASPQEKLSPSEVARLERLQLRVDSLNKGALKSEQEAQAREASEKKETK
jgi:hypothetical protein